MLYTLYLLFESSTGACLSSPTFPSKVCQHSPPEPQMLAGSLLTPFFLPTSDPSTSPHLPVTRPPAASSHCPSPAFAPFRRPASFRVSAMSSSSIQAAVDRSVSAKEDLDGFIAVANFLADAAGEVIGKYFRKSFEILDKDDLSPVTIADRAAEESMMAIILEHFPSHAIYGEENGWRCRENDSDYVWVLDPIDGTKSFITGKPLFGTLIALVRDGVPILGIIDQPILKGRWIGAYGRKTTYNGQEVSTRACSKLSQAYLYTTSPHLFNGDAAQAFARVRSKVKVPLYGCDCYAYALLASGFVDLMVESGLKPYDFLSLVPVIEGAGGILTDWNGQKLHWKASPTAEAASYDTLAAGDKEIHGQALELLQW